MDTILVVDDEASIRDLIETILEDEGYHVVTAPNGEEALLKVDSEMPDLILLDLVMPGKSGFDVCKILKNQPKTKHIPVIVSTVLGREVDKVQTKEAGADAHFLKPFTPKDLLAEVSRHLDDAKVLKFSRQLSLEHGKLKGKKLLLEFDPSTPYERLVRDFALECVHHNEKVIVVTKRGSAIRQVLEDEQRLELVDSTPDLMLSPIIEKRRDRTLSLVYDSLTDLALSTDTQTAYKFAQKAIELMTDQKMIALFLLDPAAHDQKETHSLEGLFRSQITYGKQGVTGVRIT